MKKRIFAMLACVLAMMCVLVGCVRTEVGVELKPDGSGTVGTVVMIQKEAYDMMKESGDPAPGKETFTETVDGKEYVGTRESTEYDSADELKSALLALTFAGNLSDMENRVSDEKPENLTDEIVITPDEPENETSEQAAVFRSVEIEKNGGKLTFRAALAPQNDEGSEILSGMGVNDMYKLKVSVTMPGEIKSHNAGTAEKTTVTWEIQDLTAENSIEIVSETGSGSIVPVIIVALLILVLLAVIGILLAKKKHQK